MEKRSGRQEALIGRIHCILRKLFVASLLITALPYGCTHRSENPLEWESYSKYLRSAERHQREEDFDKAIEAYKSHIELRLAAEDRPQWENPYFYFLLIGDLYLQQNDIEKALNSYSYAKEKDVDVGLVSDRYRLVANKLASEGKYDEAISLLNEHREIDPLLYDMMRDRVAREMVIAEESEL